MTLTGEQKRRLHDALLAAFPTDAELGKMVSFGLSMNLATVAPSQGNLSEMVFALLRWAEAHGRIEELVRAALDMNPGNRELAVVAAQLSETGAVIAPARAAALPSRTSELRLFFERSAAVPATAYQVRIEFDGERSRSRPFAPILSDDDYEDLRWYLEDYMDLPDAGARVRATRVERRLAEWGRALYDAAFESAEGGRFLTRFRDAEGTHLVTIATDDGAILRLPWELMADERGPLSRQEITIRRQLATTGALRRFDIALPLRVLLIVSRPDDAGFIDTRLTARPILDALDPLGDDVTVEFCDPPTVSRMEEMLSSARRNKRPYHVVHFEGHGTFLPELSMGALLFEMDEEAGGGVKTDVVPADRIGNLLARFDIPFVILEACRSGTVSNEAVFQSVAPRLLQAGVGSVLSMSHAVHVEAARILIERLYREFVQHRTIGEALEEGRGALMATPHRWIEPGPTGRKIQLQDWFLPALYQRGDDVRLVPVSAAVTSSDGDRKRAARRTPAGFPPPPAHRFHGRARELHQLERAFRRFRAVLLYAMGGMGKTSLAREAAFWWTRTGRFPDGACFVSFEQGGGADMVVRTLGTYLEGMQFESLPGEEQYRRAIELFRMRRVLLVWDNFESVLPAFQQDEGEPGVAAGASRGAIGSVELFNDEQRNRLLALYRDLVTDEDGAEGAGRLLVTCRPDNTGLTGVQEFELHGLARPDSLYLIARILETARLTLDDPRLSRASLDKLLNALADHPLSIELVAPHLRQKGMTPEKIVQDFDALMDQFQRDGAAEARNSSLRASLAFSTRRLSNRAREMLPWLGLFHSGVFEPVLLGVSGVNAATWEAVRGELEATALIRVEWDLQLGRMPWPYLRFHPTLPYAERGAGLSGDEAVRKRYIGVYSAVIKIVDGALRGQNPRVGMEMMAREEPNLRAAVNWALAAGAFAVAGALSDTIGLHLQMAGRLREKGAWATWLTGEMRRAGFTEEVAAQEREAAMALLAEGYPRKALEKLQALVERLGRTTEFDPIFQLATTETCIGRLLVEVGQEEIAIPLLERCAERFKALSEREKQAGGDARVVRGNLSAVFGALANAHRRAGRFNEARAMAGRGLEISRALGQQREVALGLDQIASILAEEGKYQDAEIQYEEAIKAVRRAGDKLLEGGLLQHQGSLADDMGQFARAATLYGSALQLFQGIGEEIGLMQTCNLLGVVEQKQGRLAEARAWYERSHEIAWRRGYTSDASLAAQNLGIVCHQEGEAALKRKDRSTADRHLANAEQWLQKSLAIGIANSNQLGEARSRGQLAQLFLLRGDLNKAEEHAHRAREIHESLGLKEVHLVYETLTQIERARGNEAGAAAWQRKCYDKLADRERLAGAASALPPPILRVLQWLITACAQVAAGVAQLPPEADTALTQLAAAPPPLNALAPFLRDLSQGTIGPIPDGLPDPLPDFLAQVVSALREARA